jgi:NAD(P)-dependent dehydrogenase (short-subunit alcohol dehydrogenase family)
MSEPSKVALVTGGARRIGRAICERLAHEGYALIIHCNVSVADGEALAASIRGQGGDATVIAADLADPDAVSGLGEMMGAAFGPVTLLVNNASMFVRDDLLSLDVPTWNRQFSVNIRAPSVLAGAMARALPEDMAGAIINIIDQRVWKLTPEYYSYTLSKAAMWAATQTMAQRLSPRIRVNAVGPGPALANHDGAEALAREAAGTLLGLVVAPEAVAEAVAYLANAAHVTGQMIAVDSGQHLAWKTPDIVTE